MKLNLSEKTLVFSLFITILIVFLIAPFLNFLSLRNRMLFFSDKSNDELSRLLENQNFREADKLTTQILKNTEQVEINNLKPIRFSRSYISSLPCPLLSSIDSEWRKHSMDKFGFSIQSNIYNDLQGEINLFISMVGWGSGDKSFSLNSPKGFFPFDIMQENEAFSILKKVEDCNSSYDNKY